MKKYVTIDGIDISILPMIYVNVTQVPNNEFSHKGSVSAWDNAGNDNGIDDVFSPFDAEIVWKDEGSAKTGVLISNTKEILTPNGLIKPYNLNVLFWHDNNITDLYVGQKIKQCEVFYQEGTAGHAIGNHVHFNVGIGKYKKGTYPLTKNEFGVWEIKGEIDPTKIFFITNEHIIKNTKGMNWKKYEEPIIEKQKLKVGDKVKVSGSYYATGEKVPSFVKFKIYTIEKTLNEKVLLKEIKSWLYEKDVSLV